MARLLILLPCYNEELALPGLLARLEAVRRELMPQWDLEALVVDDGSADQTAEIAGSYSGELRVAVVLHGANRGLGAALETGVSEFLARTDTPSDQDAVLGAMDADGTHPPELLPMILDRLEKGDPDVVIASRYAPGGGEFGLPPLRRLYSRLAGTVMRIAARVPVVRDYSCAYRVYRRSVLAKTAERYGQRLITELGFVCMVELLVKLARSGARFAEVGMELHYELKDGPSKMNVAGTIRRYAAFTLRVLFNPDLR